MAVTTIYNITLTRIRHVTTNCGCYKIRIHIYFTSHAVYKSYIITGLQIDLHAILATNTTNNIPDIAIVPSTCIPVYLCTCTWNEQLQLTGITISRPSPRNTQKLTWIIRADRYAYWLQVQVWHGVDGYRYMYKYTYSIYRPRHSASMGSWR